MSLRVEDVPDPWKRTDTDRERGRGGGVWRDRDQRECRVEKRRRLGDYGRIYRDRKNMS